MACWAHPLCLVKSVFVAKSTLATVCLSISPVWQRWKELLFRGQPHPTLINNAARARGREGEGAEVEGDRGGREGSRPNQQHPTLSSVLTPFLPSYLFIFTSVWFFFLFFYKPTNVLSSLASSPYPPVTLCCYHSINTNTCTLTHKCIQKKTQADTLAAMAQFSPWTLHAQHPTPSLLLFILPPFFPLSPPLLPA